MARADDDRVVRLSLAAAMALRLMPGRFWRDGYPGCLNLLLEYADGCRANCSYCGLARGRAEPASDAVDDSFIRVAWPRYPLTTIVDRLRRHPDSFRRVCLSMVVHPHAFEDALAILARVGTEVDLPLSLLAAPTVARGAELQRLRDVGVDKFTVAFDAATEALFRHHRGRGVQGPLRWGAYWRCLEGAVNVFGHGNIGAHWIVGLGETERDMVSAYLRVRSIGGSNHLFSFYPEPGSRLADGKPPPLSRYRRMQLARYLIDEGVARQGDFEFDDAGRLVDFGVARAWLDTAIDSGEPFRTSGCPGPDGSVACNRPFGNSRPGPKLRNYPFALDPSDVRRARRQLGQLGSRPGGSRADGR